MRSLTAARAAGMRDTGAGFDLSLSLSSPATYRALLLLCAYVGVALVLMNTVRTSAQARGCVQAMALSALVLAVFGIAQNLAGADKIYWLASPPHGATFFGPFANQDHFAAYVNMALGASIGLLLSSRMVSDVLGWPEWRDRLAWLSSRGASGLALQGLVVAILVVASLASGSIVGRLSLAATAIALLATTLLRSRVPRRAYPLVSALALLLLAIAVWRASRVLVAGSQALVLTDALRLFLLLPAAGTGFGVFRHAFPLVQSPGLESRWLHAHGDWVQLWAEGGVIGAALFGLVLVCWLADLHRHSRRAHPRAKLLVVGLMVGLASIALQSVVDYALRKPANVFILCGLAAVATAASRLRATPRHHPARAGRAVLTGRAGTTVRSRAARRRRGGADARGA